MWSSTSATIATVGENGFLTALLAGNAEISAEYEGQSTTVSLEVTPAILTSIMIETLDSMEIGKGETLQLRAVGIYRDGTMKDITTKVAWSSLDTTKATISDSGLLVVKTLGLVTIKSSIGTMFETVNLTIMNLGVVTSDDYPNTIQGAEAIDLNIMINGDIEVSDDVDYFTFALDGRTSVEFERVSNLGNVGIKNYAHFGVIDSMGTVLLDDTSKDYETRKNALTLEAGTYYVALGSYSNNLTGYQFRLSAN